MFHSAVSFMLVTVERADEIVVFIWNICYHCSVSLLQLSAFSRLLLWHVTNQTELWAGHWVNPYFSFSLLWKMIQPKIHEMKWVLWSTPPHDGVNTCSHPLWEALVFCRDAEGDILLFNVGLLTVLFPACSVPVDDIQYPSGFHGFDI